VKERFLAIETSSARLSLALGDEASIAAKYQGPLAWRHAEVLFDGITGLLKKMKWSPASLTGIATSTGPGSFTGIRIGLAAGRAWAQAAGIPMVGVNALETLASGIRGARWVCPIFDALRGHVFTALFERTPQGRIVRRLAECHVPVDVWEAQIAKVLPDGETVTLAGDGVRVVGTARRPFQFQARPEKDWYPLAAELLALARPQLANAKPMNYKTVLPFYLREAAVTERRA
jgi:tRNA threonylcarbamoyladenosine biosynthesis protein TsaB